MWQTLVRNCGELAVAPARAVILRGVGAAAFSTGADISEFQAFRSDPDAVVAYNRAISSAMDAVRDLPIPVIAQLAGLCVGGGLALAAMADLRVADDTCRFGIPAGKLGIAYRPDWINRIADLIGPAPVAELLLTATMVSAGDAFRWGLVNRLCLPDQLESETERLAVQMGALAPLTHRATKAALAARAGHETRAVAEHLAAACDDSQDYLRGTEAFRNGTKPIFEGN
ncbi:enoyl-CoA hydratase-related protein [Paracoccus saliphilus]|nr:enoyl-CoA hydratase-related protein [Paracoccus saliphilus]